MKNILNQKQETLIESAKKQQLLGVDLQSCWSLVIKGLEYQILDSGELEELLNLLKQGWDYINDELGFEFIGDRLRIRFLDEKYFCSPKELVIELEKLINHIN